MRGLSLLGRKVYKSVPDEARENKSDSVKPDMQQKLVWVCPNQKLIAIYCQECEDLREFETVECIENGNLEHRYKCLKCGVILDEPLPTL